MSTLLTDQVCGTLTDCHPWQASCEPYVKSTYIYTAIEIMSGQHILMIDFPLLYICLKSTAVTPVNTICTVKKGHS